MKGRGEIGVFFMVKYMYGCWRSCDEQVPGDAHNSHAQSRLCMLDLERVLALLGMVRSNVLLEERQHCLHSCPHTPGLDSWMDG